MTSTCLLFFEFSNGFHNFSFGDEPDDFADDKNDGARPGDDDEHGENFSGVVERMHFAIPHAEHRDDDHVNRVHEIPAVKVIAADADGKNHRQIKEAAPELAKNALCWSGHDG
jgi:hypothetical protein